MMGSGCFEPGQVVLGRVFSGTWWDLVLNAPSGGGFCEVNLANTPLTCHCCLQSGKGLVWHGRGPGCPIALYREYTWASMGTGHSQGKSKRPHVGFSTA